MKLSMKYKEKEAQSKEFAYNMQKKLLCWIDVPQQVKEIDTSSSLIMNINGGTISSPRTRQKWMRTSSGVESSPKKLVFPVSNCKRPELEKISSSLQKDHVMIRKTVSSKKRINTTEKSKEKNGKQIESHDTFIILKALSYLRELSQVILTGVRLVQEENKSPRKLSCMSSCYSDNSTTSNSPVLKIYKTKQAYTAELSSVAIIRKLRELERKQAEYQRRLEMPKKLSINLRQCEDVQDKDKKRRLTSPNNDFSFAAVMERLAYQPPNPN